MVGLTTVAIFWIKSKKGKPEAIKGKDGHFHSIQSIINDTYGEVNLLKTKVVDFFKTCYDEIFPIVRKLDKLHSKEDSNGRLLMYANREVEAESVKLMREVSKGQDKIVIGQERIIDELKELNSNILALAKR